MSIISRIPDNSRVLFPSVLFTSADLDGDGNYSWETPGNTKVTLIETLNQGHVYLIERASFTANVDLASWLESMLTVADFPRVSVQFPRIGGASIFGDPFRCVNYVENAEMLIYFEALQKGDSLAATMFGKVKQTSGMAGLLNLLAQINFTVYEITDKSWIQEYKRNPARLGLVRA